MALVKPSYNADRIILGERLPIDTPLSVILDVSERCNFKCNYCFRSGQKDESWGFAASNELMPQEIFERAVRQLKEFSQKLKSVSLSGHGEPLCNPCLADMARQLKESGVTENIDIHTNASLLTKANVKDIAGAGFTRIVVSLQGLNAAAYKRVCGAKMDWECFYNNLKLLYESKYKDLKIHIKIADAALEEKNYAEDEERFHFLFDGIADYIFVEKTVPLWRNIDIDADMATTKFGGSFGDVDYCPLVFYKMMVAPDGEIYPCTGLPPPTSFGNIRGVTLLEVWNSRERNNFLKEHLRLTRHNHAPCKGCFVPVNSIMSHEDIIDPYKDAILKRLEGQPDDKGKN